jgi:hypothetical protein
MKKINLDINLLIKEYTSGKTIKELSIKNSCSVSTVRKELKNAGIILKNINAKKDIDPFQIKFMIAGGYYPKEIAEHFSVSVSTIWYKMKKNNIKYSRTRNYSPPKVGEKFNRWTFLKDLGIDSVKNKRIWLCECSCGTKKELDYYSVKIGDSTSCGCYHKENQKKIRWKGHEKISGKYWSQIKKGAENRGIDFDIDIEYAWGIYLKQNKKCSLSNLDILFGKKGFNPSLDRIDSAKGYVKGNVQWVTQEINYMKMNLKEKDFIFFCKKISENAKQN